MPDSTHARFSPSKLARIMACPGSVRLSESLPEPAESPYAAEGTMLHEKIKELIDYGIKHDIPLTNLRPETVVDSIEHAILLKDCLEHVAKLMTSPCTVFQDLKVSMRGPLGGDIYGTLDLAIMTDADELHVIDFKFGAGVEVSAVENRQLMSYADGMLKYLGFGAIFDSGKVPLVLHIFQPRLSNWSDYVLQPAVLGDFVRSCTEMVTEANMEQPPFRAGQSQCRWCPAGAVCSERMRSVQATAAEAFSVLAVRESWTEDVDRLAALYAKKAQVIDLFAQIEDFLFSELQQSRPVPGFKLVNGRASRKWREWVDGMNLNDLADAIDVELEDLYAPRELRSPAQLEKLISSDRRKLLTPFIEKIEGAPKMVSAESKKPGIDVGANAQQAFLDAGLA